MLGTRQPDALGAVRTLSAAAAVPTLMANRHMAEILDRAGHARDFRVLADVARHVPARLVDRADGLEHLDGVVDAILADAGAVAAMAAR